MVYHDALMAAKAAFVEDFQRRLVEEEPEQGWKASGRKTKAMPNGEDSQWWIETGPTFVENYAKWRTRNPHLQIWNTPEGQPGIELGFNVPVPGTSVMLRGYVDRVFIDHDAGSALIVDIKSGARAQDSQMQLEFYRIGLKHALGIDIPYGAYWNARKGDLDEIVELDHFPEDRVFRWVRNMLATLDQNLLIPSVGMQCSWCSVKDYCPTQATNVPDFDATRDLATAAE